MASLDKLKTLAQLFDLRYLNGWNSLRSSLGFTRTLFMPSSGVDNLEQIFNLPAHQPHAGQLRSTKRTPIPSHCISGLLYRDQSCPSRG